MYIALERLQEGCVQVPTDLKALTKVITWFDRFDTPLMPHMPWLECQLALAEGFTNAVRHAHSDKAVETPIDIHGLLTDKWIELRIWDHGPGFAFEEYFKQASASIDQHAEGGRGLGLIKKIADTVEYIQEPDQRNCLRILKYYSHDQADETLSEQSETLDE
ncbi:MAG: ATP-binding protein [Symploca sp. SIO3C6]|nr:ATP-binding protein [Symploca sp. SIO3C6]